MDFKLIFTLINQIISPIILNKANVICNYDAFY